LDYIAEEKKRRLRQTERKIKKREREKEAANDCSTLS
jgi:hypothetical protein